MMDRTVHQAVKAGARTSKIGRAARPKTIKGNIRLDAEELAIALDMARQARTEQDIRDYAHRKRASA